MGAEENIYEKLKEYLGLREDNINILEESIDTDLQMEYFEYSRNKSGKKTEEEIMRNKDIIFDNALSVASKKSALVELASINSIEAYRTIERYLNQPDIKLYDWACLALQESRLHLETHLLNENKVLITTGLGGKGLKLRYFIVLFTKNGIELTAFQKEVIEKELKYELCRQGAELEDIIFDDCFASVLAIIPLKVHFQKLFRNVIFECNQIGGFLFNDFIITNVKALSKDEIQELLQMHNIY
ncbi:MAG: hypothetical protein JXB34_02295 [Bacteroidales bacterium]|nr:hypothetical protein [Bacteroidales bacterium]